LQECTTPDWNRPEKEERRSQRRGELRRDE